MRLIQNGLRKSASSGALTGLDMTKLAKFVKIATVNVHLVETPKQRAETKNLGLGELEEELSNWYYQQQPELSVGYQTIAIDGLTDWHESVGTLNWYCKAQNKDRVLQLIQQWVALKQQQGFQIRVRGPMGSNSRDLMVYRLDVVHNPTAEIPRAPEMQITGSNWAAALQALNLRADPQGGTLPLQTMAQALMNFKPHLINEFTQDPEESGGPGTGQARMIEFGRTDEQMMRYVETLREMVAFGSRNGYQEIGWG